jgi:hypothetical protein
MKHSALGILAAACLLHCAGASSYDERISEMWDSTIEDVHSGVPGTGAEDADLWGLRAAQRKNFHTLIYAMLHSPHVALGGVRFLGGETFDSVIFGSDESKSKSPYTPLKSILVPGFTCTQYLWHFFDTNPFVTVLICVGFILSDVTFWAGFLLPLFISRRFFQSLFKNTKFAVYTLLGAFLGSSIFYFAFPIIPWFLVDLVFYLALIWFPFRSFFQLKSLFKALRAVVQRGPAVADPQRLKAALAAVKGTAPLLEQSDWSSKYSAALFGSLGEGGFGSVKRGVCRATGEDVAIKFLNVSAPTDLQLLAVGLAVNAIGASPDVGELLEIAVKQQVLKIVDNSSEQNAMHEVRALLAARTLGHRGLIHLKSAHRESTGAGKPSLVTIVTRLAGGSWKDALESASFQNKLLSCQRACDAIAALHSAGIVHRDIKPDNIAVSPSDSLQPIILDVGIALVPGVDDPFAGAGTPTFMPPEHYSFQQSGIRAGIMSTPADVCESSVTHRGYFYVCVPSRLAPRPASHILPLAPCSSSSYFHFPCCFLQGPLDSPSARCSLDPTPSHLSDSTGPSTSSPWTKPR